MTTKNKKGAKGSNREEVTGVRKRPRFDIVPEQVKDEYTRMPSLIATATEEYSEALRKALDAKSLRDQTFARKYLETVQHYEDLDEKKPNETFLKQKVTIDEEYVQAVADYNEAEFEKSRLLGDLEGLRTKRDMLVSLGAHVRLEMQQTGGGTQDDDENEDMDMDEEED